jgi:transcriptional regulator with XRE-family HTH domain
MAKGTFGERLKRERELREVSLEEIAKGTRIAERFLEALENEQWEKLPGGVFGRGFVRSIARYLGLSEENLLSEYDLARGESANPPPQKLEERIPAPPKWMPAAVVLALVALAVALVVGGHYAWKAYQAHRPQKKSSAIVGLPSSVETQWLPAPAYAEPAVTGLATALDLQIAATTSTLVRAVADRDFVFDCQLSPGRTRHFSGIGPVRLTPADPSAVLLNLNGQRVAPLGTPGSSGTIVLTESDLRQANGGDTQR